MDREKVKKGLECCLTLDSPCGDCPYYSYEDIQELDCERNLRHDALALLKEQEDDYRNILLDYEDLAREHEKLLNKKIPLITNGQEVIRCKDCIYGKHEKNESTGMEWVYCGHHRENRPKDWFCASGSRI